MNPTNMLLLLTVLSGLIGGVSHSLSTDGGASILDHFGIEARLPKSSVAIAVLGCTGGAALVDTLVSGSDWQHALAAAGMAFTAALFGAAKGQTAGAKVALVLCTVGLGLSLTACPAALTDSCIAIKAADDVCTMITIPNPDGGAPEQIKVSGPELRAFAHQRAAAHAQASDGGVEAGQ